MSSKRRTGGAARGSIRWIKDNAIVLREAESADVHVYRPRTLVASFESTLRDGHSPVCRSSLNRASQPPQPSSGKLSAIRM